MHRTHSVYILSSNSGCLYVGVTNNLQRRVQEHKAGTGSDFTAKHAVNILVYFETFKYIDQAIQREKQLKRWSRSKKLWLIETVNPDLCDLAEYW